MTVRVSRRTFLQHMAAALAAAPPPGAAAASPAAASTPALLGGTPVRRAPFPSWPVTDRLEDDSLLDTILEVARGRGIPVIEDACQAHLAEWRGRKVGTLGTTGCFSFQASKNLNSGEGGALLTNDERVRRPRIPTTTTAAAAATRARTSRTAAAEPTCG